VQHRWKREGGELRLLRIRVRRRRGWSSTPHGVIVKHVATLVVTKKLSQLRRLREVESERFCGGARKLVVVKHRVITGRNAAIGVKKPAAGIRIPTT
jgi:hypothetical protein